MDLGTVVMGVGGGYILGYVSRHLAGWWKRTSPAIAPEVAHILDMLEKKFDIDIPDGLEMFFVNTIAAGVRGADKFVSDPAFIRNVIRAVASKDTNKLQALEEYLLSVDWKSNVVAQLPPEIKEIVNVLKEDKVVADTKANMAKVMPVEKLPTDEKIREYVKATVSASKIEAEPAEITQDIIKKLIQESKDRQEKLKSSGAIPFIPKPA